MKQSLVKADKGYNKKGKVWKFRLTVNTGGTKPLPVAQLPQYQSNSESQMNPKKIRAEKLERGKIHAK